jgi:large subunit ribosomal protein L10
MAVTRADKDAELQVLESAFQGSDSAILIDYKGLNVPQVTDLRRQLRAAKASYKVVKNTIAKRALKGTSFEPLSAFATFAAGLACGFGLARMLQIGVQS